MDDAQDSDRPGGAGQGFTPRPRRQLTGRANRAASDLTDELIRILHRVERVSESDRDSFTDGTQAHDVACMAIIRLAALLERPDSTTLSGHLTEDEVAAIRTTRNIAAHAGYRGMNDDLFWIAITTRVPEIIRRLLDATER